MLRDSEKRVYFFVEWDACVWPLLMRWEWGKQRYRVRKSFRRRIKNRCGGAGSCPPEAPADSPHPSLASSHRHAAPLATPPSRAGAASRSASVGGELASGPLHEGLAALPLPSCRWYCSWSPNFGHNPLDSKEAVMAVA